jgi:hypothetical protein
MQPAVHPFRLLVWRGDQNISTTLVLPLPECGPVQKPGVGLNLAFDLTHFQIHFRFFLICVKLDTKLVKQKCLPCCLQTSLPLILWDTG